MQGHVPGFLLLINAGTLYQFIACFGYAASWGASPSPSHSPPDSNGSENRTKKLAAIIGAVVGASVLIIITAIVFTVLRSKKRLKTMQYEIGNGHSLEATGPNADIATAVAIAAPSGGEGGNARRSGFYSAVKEALLGLPPAAVIRGSFQNDSIDNQHVSRALESTGRSAGSATAISIAAPVGGEGDNVGHSGFYSAVKGAALRLRPAAVTRGFFQDDNQGTSQDVPRSVPSTSGLVQQGQEGNIAGGSKSQTSSSASATASNDIMLEVDTDKNKNSSSSRGQKEEIQQAGLGGDSKISMGGDRSSSSSSYTGGKGMRGNGSQADVKSEESALGLVEGSGGGGAAFPVLKGTSTSMCMGGTAGPSIGVPRDLTVSAQSGAESKNMLFVMQTTKLLCGPVSVASHRSMPWNVIACNLGAGLTRPTHVAVAYFCCCCSF